MAKQLQQYRTDLEQLLSTVGLSGFFSDTVKNSFINMGGKRVYNFTAWVWLQHALKTTTEENWEWYDQPTQFKRGSIYRITVADEEGIEQEHDIRPRNEYEDIKKGGGDSKVATLLDDQYFIYPIPTVEGREISVFGQKKWTELTNDTDETISPEEIDESIVRMAFAFALQKERRFSEAQNQIQDVEENMLPRLKSNDEKEAPKGYMGQQKSTRW